MRKDECCGNCVYFQWDKKPECCEVRFRECYECRTCGKHEMNVVSYNCACDQYKEAEE